MAKEEKLVRDRLEGTAAEPCHPALGSMIGQLTIPPGVDLTEPTCPDWEAYAERKYGPDSKLGKLWAQVVMRESQRHGNGNAV